MEIIPQRIMWGKVIGYQPWPCVVLAEDEYEGPSKPSNNKTAVWFPVQFFGEASTAWLEEKYLYDYSSNREKFTSAKNSQKKLFMKAVTEADEHLNKQREDEYYLIQVNKKFTNRSRKNEQKQYQPNVRLQTKVIQNNEVIVNESKKPVININPFGKFRKIDSVTKLCNHSVGVIGLDCIGVQVATNLVKGGFQVNIYDEPYKKCTRLERKLKDIGKLNSFQNIDSLVVKSEVLFFCMDNERKVRELMRKNFKLTTENTNVLKNKGIFNMTSMDPDYSVELAEVVDKLQGKYLEVCFQGDKTEASSGNLVLLMGGNIELFENYLPCFKAISQSVFHVGPAGYASKINLSLQMIKGATIATLGEQIYLMKTLGIPTDIYTDILNNCGLSSNYIKKKVTKILDQTYSATEEPLDYLQRSMKLGLKEAEKISHPMPMAHNANEIFKVCQRYCYGGYDSSSVMLKYKND